MTNIVSEKSEQLPLAEQLNKIGEEQCIIREEGEPDAVYAERMIYELDVFVEELWACQDRVRELIHEDE